MERPCTPLGAVALALLLAGCASIGGAPTPTATAHVQLDPSLASQSVYLSVWLGDLNTQQNGMTVALNAQTGALRWKTHTTGTFASPAVANGVVYVASVDTTISAQDAATGKPLWSYTRTVGVGSQYGWDGYATASGNTVYVASDSGAAFALDTATGKPRWVATWPTQSDTLYVAPTVDGGLVFVAVQGPDGGAYALDAATGKTVWKTVHSFGFDARPLVAGGVVYFVSSWPNMPLVALDERTGAMRWQAGSWGSAPLIAPWNSPAVAGDGLIYNAGADRIIRAFHIQDGSPSWTFQTGGNAASSQLGTGAAMTLVGSTLYAGSQGGDLYALDAVTGKQRWSVTISSPIDAPPAVAGGAVFVTTESGKVLAFRASDGAPAWSYSGGSTAFIATSPVVAPDRGA